MSKIVQWANIDLTFFHTPKMIFDKKISRNVRGCLEVRGTGTLIAFRGLVAERHNPQQFNKLRR